MLRKGKEYIESLKDLKPRVYFLGKRIESVVNHPFFKPHITAAAMTYELAHHPQYREVMTAKSHLTNEKVNRFTHIHRSIDDLVKKVKMMRILGQKTGTCFQRCVGLDALNALYIVTHEIDSGEGTNYHQRFIEYLKYIQGGDLMPAGAMTDPKGVRNLNPHQQPDPDLYVHVVEKGRDGIVVRGAKCQITGAVNSHEIIVLPTRTMRKEDSDYAVAFSVPVDEKGVTLIVSRQTNDTRRLEAEIDAGNPKYGVVGGEALIVFDDVFVPWERVFMCGEYKYSLELVEAFSSHHRSNYGGCKVGIADVAIGACKWIADSHGLTNVYHIRDKLTEMVQLAETCWSCSLACAYEGYRTKSGAYMVNPLLANVVKLNITRMTYEWMRLAQDIAGGTIITMPSELDYRNPDVGRYIEKFYRVKEEIPTEHRMRMMRLIENIAVGAGLPESLHGAGSPGAQKVMIERRSNLEEKKKLAEIIAGIKEDEHFRDIWEMSEKEFFTLFKGGETKK